MNYPGGIKHSKSTINKCINYANRGISLEEELNITNDYYRDIDKAIIYKKPTPIKVVKANFVSRQNAKITEAYFAMPSTTDYNGIYKGKYIDFEAKETTSSTSFPLTNIHKHQLLHLKKVYEHNGISFIIVRFTHLNETYLLFEKELDEFINTNNRKSIPLDYFKEKGYLIKDKFNPRIDYLEVIDNIGGIYNEKRN